MIKFHFHTLFNNKKYFCQKFLLLTQFCTPLYIFNKEIYIQKLHKIVEFKWEQVNCDVRKKK